METHCLSAIFLPSSLLAIFSTCTFAGGDKGISPLKDLAGGDKGVSSLKDLAGGKGVSPLKDLHTANSAVTKGTVTSRAGTALLHPATVQTKPFATRWML